MPLVTIIPVLKSETNSAAVGQFNPSSKCEVLARFGPLRLKSRRLDEAVLV